MDGLIKEVSGFVQGLGRALLPRIEAFEIELVGLGSVVPPLATWVLASPDRRSRNLAEIAPVISYCIARASESLRSYCSPQRLRLVRASISSELMMSWSPRCTIRPVTNAWTFNSFATI